MLPRLEYGLARVTSEPTDPRRHATFQRVTGRAYCRPHRLQPDGSTLYAFGVVTPLAFRRRPTFADDGPARVAFPIPVGYFH